MCSALLYISSIDLRCLCHWAPNVCITVIYSTPFSGDYQYQSHAGYHLLYYQLAKPFHQGPISTPLGHLP